jgi:hypothetical protein
VLLPEPGMPIRTILVLSLSIFSRTLNNYGLTVIAGINVIVRRVVLLLPTICSTKPRCATIYLL